MSDIPGQEEGQGGFQPERLKDRIKDLQAAMFDLDGTLIDTIPVYIRMAAAVLEEIGLPPAPRESVAAMLKSGLSGFHHLIPKGMSEWKEELIEAGLEAGKRISARLYPDSIPLIPGSEELFHRLAGAGVRIGIVSSSHKRHLERKLSPLKEAGLVDLVEAVIAIEDTSRMKPFPEPVQACARRLGVAEGKSLLVGDADVDILAGKRAGTFTIGVMSGVDDYATLAANNPDLIVSSVQDLVPLF